MTTTTTTLTELPCHPEHGWRVDPKAGIVYGIAGRWVGKQLGRIGSHGYLMSTSKGRSYLLHRVVWEACVGPIPAGMVINHKNGSKMDNRLSNLEVVTSSQNNQHAIDTGLKVRHGVSGPRNSNYKVTPAMRLDILRRLAAGETCGAVGRAFEISTATVHRVKSAA